MGYNYFEIGCGLVLHNSYNTSYIVLALLCNTMYYLQTIVSCILWLYLQMMNRLEPLFYNGTGRQKGIPKGVDETHQTRTIWNGIVLPFNSTICQISNWNLLALF